MNNVSGVILAVVLVIALIMGAMFGIPVYNKWAKSQEGQGELNYQTFARQAEVEKARAFEDAASIYADATSERVQGWAEAAKAGCTEIGLEGDRGCLLQLMQAAATYSNVTEGSEGVTLIVGNVDAAVAVPAQ